MPHESNYRVFSLLCPSQVRKLHPVVPAVRQRVPSRRDAAGHPPGRTAPHRNQLRRQRPLAEQCHSGLSFNHKDVVQKIANIQDNRVNKCLPTKWEV